MNARPVENGLTIALGEATLFMIEGVSRGLVQCHEECGIVVAMASQDG